MLARGACRGSRASYLRIRRLADMGILKKMKMTMLALSLGSIGAVVGCNDHGRAVDGEGPTGEVGIALVLPGGATIDSVSYSITGPMGFTKTGTINVSNSTKLTGIISGIPAGMGFQITLTTTTTDGRTTCAGSA